ncbi:MAG TPA: hypothetical protein VK488_04540 [Gaiellaceae bacterium]|nr:hypothetical protein [Gaiellaceae bacterium]
MRLERHANRLQHKAVVVRQEKPNWPQFPFLLSAFEAEIDLASQMPFGPKNMRPAADLCRRIVFLRLRPHNPSIEPFWTEVLLSQDLWSEARRLECARFDVHGGLCGNRAFAERRVARGARPSFGRARGYFGAHDPGPPVS